MTPSVAEVLSRRFASRSTPADPSEVEAARARLGRVVASAGPGWLPSDPEPAREIDNAADVLPPADHRNQQGHPVTQRGAGAHARRTTDRRMFDGRALAALAVLAGLSLLIAAWYVWRSWPVSADVPDRAHVTSATAAASQVAGPGTEPTGAPAATPSDASQPPATATSAGLVVHVAGTVARPGIVTLTAGARVADAIQAAGGVLPGADTSGVNLARLLVDGEQVLVGLPAGAGASAAAGGAPAPTPASPNGVGASPLDLNTATVDDLQELPGVGPVLAQRIVDWPVRLRPGAAKPFADARCKFV